MCEVVLYINKTLANLKEDIVNIYSKFYSDNLIMRKTKINSIIDKMVDLQKYSLLYMIILDDYKYYFEILNILIISMNSIKSDKYTGKNIIALKTIFDNYNLLYITDKEITKICVDILYKTDFEVFI